MWNVSGLTTNSISPYPLVTRGMPGDQHRYVMLNVPCPPSERMDSKRARYSGVNGAGISPPLGWLWSYRPGPPTEVHCPLKSGYLLSSHAFAPAIMRHSVARTAIALI